MKPLQKYISESQNPYKSTVDSQIKSKLSAAIEHIDFTKLQETNEQDPQRFEKSKQNEKILVDLLNAQNRGGRMKDWYACGTQDYYEKTTKKKDYDSLSTKEKSMFDTENGDVVIMDTDGKPLWFIDIKISDKYLGAVSLGSLVNFNENGIYVCINKSTKDYRIFSHRDLVEIVKADRSLLKEPTKTYKGYPVEWEGENLTSEWYVKGNDIKNFER